MVNYLDRKYRVFINNFSKIWPEVQTTFSCCPPTNQLRFTHQLKQMITARRQRVLDVKISQIFPSSPVLSASRVMTSLSESSALFIFAIFFMIFSASVKRPLCNSHLGDSGKNLVFKTRIILYTEAECIKTYYEKVVPFHWLLHKKWKFFAYLLNIPR